MNIYFVGKPIVQKIITIKIKMVKNNYGKINHG
jgi:hypothetical protein